MIVSSAIFGTNNLHQNATNINKYINQNGFLNFIQIGFHLPTAIRPCHAPKRSSNIITNKDNPYVT